MESKINRIEVETDGKVKLCYEDSSYRPYMSGKKALTFIVTDGLTDTASVHAARLPHTDDGLSTRAAMRFSRRAGMRFLSTYDTPEGREVMESRFRAVKIAREFYDANPSEFNRQALNRAMALFSNVSSVPSCMKD